MATLYLKFSKNLQSFFTYPLVPHFIFSCQQILLALFFRIYPESGYLDPHFLHCHCGHSHYHLSPQSIAFTRKWLPYFCLWEFLTVCSEKSIKSNPSSFYILFLWRELPCLGNQNTSMCHWVGSHTPQRQKPLLETLYFISLHLAVWFISFNKLVNIHKCFPEFCE